MYVCIYVFAYVCVYMYCVYLYVCPSLCMYVYVHVFVCLSVCTGCDVVSHTLLDFTIDESVMFSTLSCSA